MAADLQQTLHPDAREELRAAIIWYRENAGDAIGFLSEVTHVIGELAASPERWPIVRNVTPVARYRVLPTYPYTIFYRTSGDGLLVVAIAHQKRQPLYWSRRA